MVLIDFKVIQLLVILCLINFSKSEKNNTDFLRIISKHLLNVQPIFDLSQISGVSEECRKDSRYFRESLENLDYWALEMHDATAKLPSGVLNGNINQYGDFDKCLQILAPNQKYQGQYCLAYMQPKVIEHNEYLEYIRLQIQSLETFKNDIEDSGHILPRWSTIKWGLCIPSSCSNVDVETGLKEYMSNFTKDVGVTLDIRVEELMCQTNNVNWISNLNRNTKLAIIFFVTIFLISITSTVYEFMNEDLPKNSWLTAFSLYKNFKEMSSTKREASDIKVAHGIRAFNVFILIISHKCYTMYFFNYTNRTDMNIHTSHSWTMLPRAAVLWTDTFLMLSGMFTAYSMYGRLKKGLSINLFQEYAGRYVRIFPPVVAMIIFNTYILPLLGTGPIFPSIINYQIDLCENYWWRNVLFIQNFFGFENICLTHSHYVATDSQLFVLAPLLIYLIWKWPRNGTLAVIGLALLSSFGRYVVTMQNNLSDFLYVGVSTKELFSVGDKMYVIPYYRLTPYILGIFVGCALRVRRDFLKLSEVQMKIGWIISLIILFFTFYGTFEMCYMTYNYDNKNAALFSGFSPFGWSLFNIWTILAAESGYKNKYIEFLEWKGFLLTTNISYAVYLTQFSVFHYNAGVARAPDYYNKFSTIINTYEMLSILSASVLLTLFIEIPFGNIKKLLFSNKSTTKDTVQIKSKDSENNNGHIDVKKFD